ncbi:MAG: M90 family metallopeptidase [Flavobacteriia bacterium]|jgi:Mlc titration factor MtfA (ptsG expression regulator)
MNQYLKFLEGKSRFSAWLIVFFILLITIPALLGSEMKTTAKLFGVIVMMLLSAALWIWRTQTIRKVKRKARIPINLNDKYWLNERIPFYKFLNSVDKRVFEDRIALFLAEVVITEVGKKVPEKSTCFFVACSAVIAFWGLPYWNYGDLTEVLVFPNDFSADDEADPSGNFQGKVHHGGIMDSTMILSLTSLKRGFEISRDGKNVGVHEFAHLLDKSDRSIDGIPFILGDEERQVWADMIEHYLKKKNLREIIGHQASSSPAEFFAALFELYRENPDRMRKRFPELFNLLEKNLS